MWEALFFVVLLAWFWFGLEHGDERCLPEHLKYARHDDWWRPFNRIPRRWFVFCGPHFPTPPKRLAGNSGYPGHVAHFAVKPIPWAGSWVITYCPHLFIGFVPLPLPYFAWTWKNWRHWRIGFRWDDIDSYYVWSVAGWRKTGEPAHFLKD